MKSVVCFALCSTLYALTSGCSGSKEASTATSHVAAAANPLTMESGPYMIKVGDAVELSVQGYEEFKTTTTVKESGSIVVPVIGEVHAAGLSKQALVDTLRRKLVEFVKGKPEITVVVSSSSNLRISVLGAVTRQDNYPIPGEISLLEALSTAGGPTPDSDLKHVRVIHNGNSSDYVDVDLTSSLETGNIEGVPRVQSGDIVYVPKRENVIRVFSDFLRDAVFLFGTFRLFY